MENFKEVVKGFIFSKLCLSLQKIDWRSLLIRFRKKIRRWFAKITFCKLGIPIFQMVQSLHTIRLTWNLRETAESVLKDKLGSIFNFSSIRSIFFLIKFSLFKLEKLWITHLAAGSFVRKILFPFRLLLGWLFLSFRLFSYAWYKIQMLLASIQSNKLVDPMNEPIVSLI